MSLRCTALCRALLLIGGLLVASAMPVWGQSVATVRIEENFRREPADVILARLSPGTMLEVLARDGNWTRVEVEGWVWLASLEASADDAFDLAVSAVDGENLRSGPAGRVLGRLEEGTLLRELERDASWAHVSRTGWMWTASLEVEEAGNGSSEDGDPTGRRVPGAAASRAPAGFFNVGSTPAPILSAPDGHTLAIMSPQSDVEVVGREGNWVRVRVEGWMWLPAAQEGVASTDESPLALEPADLAADPSAYAGRVVSWSLQFISLERAEAVRTDFFEGEPFLLARFGGADGTFVYVAVPNDRLADVEGLVPLELVSVVGRIRTGASALTGTPIVDLITIERSRDAR